MKVFLNNHIKKILVLLLISNIITATLFIVIWEREGYTGKVLDAFNLKETTAIAPDYWALYSWQTCLENLDIDSDIVFYGDSITRGGAWQDWFDNVSICNLGYSGDTIEGLTNRIDMVKSVSPEKVFIMIGVNDIIRSDYDNTIIQGYKELINLLYDYNSNIKIYVMSILPTREPEERNNDATVKVNKELKLLSDEYKYTYIDLHSLFANEDGDMIEEYTVDGVHLNDAGYEVIVNSIKHYVYE